MKKNTPLIIDILIIISSSLGLYLTLFSIGNFMNFRGYLYYTVQSNIIVLIISIIFAIFKLLKKKIPNWLNKIRFISTVGISITFLVFTFMLVPQMFGGFNKYLLSIGNLTVHFISPILCVIHFLLYSKISHNKYTYLLGICMPLLYFIFIMILTLIIKEPLFGGLDNTLNRFPYFFMDYESNGWLRINGGIFELGMFYWFIIISIVTLAISKLYLHKKEKIL